MPPRHGKSELASIRFPAWWLGRHPDKRLILACYSADLAERHSRAVRACVQTPAYRQLFPGVAIDQASRSVQQWDLLGRRGGMKAVGVGGPLTGFGADVLLVDDPLKNRAEANSETIRSSVWDWWTSTAYTRLEDNAAIVVISTRWHEDDLTGRLLAAQGTDPRADRWDVVHMPAISDTGAALWPEKYSLADLDHIRANIGPYDWEALYQGRPTAPEGAMFKRDWFQIVDAAPPALDWVRGWDLAASAKESADYTAGARCALDEDGNLWIEHIERRRQEWPETVKDMAFLASMTDRGSRWGVEAAGFQLSAVQQLLSDPRFMGVAISKVAADRDKVARAAAWQTRAEARKVFLVRGDWVAEFIREACAFPQGKHDDQIDAVSIAWELLTDGFIQPRIWSLDGGDSSDTDDVTGVFA